uniref:Uncharacterized protein n=1 Tax=Oryza brachyantha TaxID=4533 RepID=J3MX91_ORYBR
MLHLFASLSAQGHIEVSYLGVAGAGGEAAGHVNDEAVADVVLLQPLKRRVDVVHLDHLHIGVDAVLAGHVEHGLAFPDAADAVAGDALPTGHDGAGRQLQQPGRHAEEYNLPHRLHQGEERRDRVPRRRRVEDAVHGAGRRRHLARVAADEELVGAKVLQRLLPLPRRRADYGHTHAERLAELDGEVAEPAEADNAQVLARRVQAVEHHRAVHRHAGAKQRSRLVQRHPRRDAEHV